MITGTAGINHELIEQHNNFSWFSLLHHKEESDKEILTRVKRQGKLILERIKELKSDDDHIFLSKEKPDSKEVITLGREPHPSGTYDESESELTKPVLESIKHTTSRDTEEKESYSDNLDTETEQGCNHCMLLFEQPGQIKENDGVYINRSTGEILIFPNDESHDEGWIQEHLIDPKIIREPDDNDFFSKTDSMKLEQFLKREQEVAAVIIK